MKKFSFLALLAAAGLAVGCSEELAENGNGSVEARKIQVSFGVDIASEDSRSEVDLVDGKVQGNWVLDTDQIGVYSNTADVNVPFTYGDNKFFNIFNGELTEASEYTLQAYYPYGADYASGTTVTIPFGVERTQEGGKFNSAYDILLSEPKTTSELDGHTFDFVRPLSVLNFDTSAAGAFRYARLTDLDGGLLSTGGLTFEMGANPTLMPAMGDSGEEYIVDASSTIWVDMGSEAAHADVFFNVLPGNYNLKLDLMTEDGKISSTTIDRTNAENPFKAGKFYYKKVAASFVAAATPSFSWPDGNGGEFSFEDAHEITVDESYALTYPAAINISAPAGIAELTVQAVSEGGFLAMMGVENLDVINSEWVIDGSMSFRSIGLQSGAAVKYAANTVFDITNLVPAILMGGTMANGAHYFFITVKDVLGNEATTTLVFTVTPVVTYNDDADYWTNTASFTINTDALELTSSDSVNLQYRVSGTDAWKEAEISDDKSTATIKAAWTENESHPAGSAWNVDNTTGIFAGKNYEWRFLKNEEELVTGVIESGNSGNTIPSGNFSDEDMSCFGTGNSSTTTWGSGNMSGITAATLCSWTEKYGTNSGVAHLTSTTTWGQMAAGNLFLGTFSFKNMVGTVNFGQNYNYNGARPYALAFDYDAKIGTTMTGTQPNSDAVDAGVVYVCIVNWSTRHATSASLGSPSGVWNPESDKQTDASHPIIARGYMEIPQGTSLKGSLQHCELVLDWYDHDTTAAPSGSYTLIISASCNKYGDYKYGCKTNEIYIDNFEWVY